MLGLGVRIHIYNLYKETNNLIAVITHFERAYYEGERSRIPLTSKLDLRKIFSIFRTFELNEIH